MAAMMKASLLWLWLVSFLLKSDIVIWESSMSWGMSVLSQTPRVQTEVLFLFGFEIQPLLPGERGRFTVSYDANGGDRDG